MLCDIEGATSKIIRSIIQSRTLPKWYSAPFRDLMTFVIVQAYRTPTAAQEIEEMAVGLVKQMAQRNYKIAPHIDNINIEYTNAVSQSLLNAVLYFPLVLDLRYKLLVNETSIPFVTSDHPVIFYNQFMERRKAVGCGLGLACKGLQIFLPLSPKLCLICFDYDVYKVGGRSTKAIQVHVNENDVISLNQLQVVNAGSQLFFNGAIQEKHLRSTIQQVKHLRSNTRANFGSANLYVDSNSTPSELLHMSRHRFWTRLSLSCVNELTSVRESSLDERMVVYRAPAYCRLYTEFVDCVMYQKSYRHTEFYRFLEERHPEICVDGKS